MENNYTNLLITVVAELLFRMCSQKQIKIYVLLYSYLHINKCLQHDYKAAERVWTVRFLFEEIRKENHPTHFQKIFLKIQLFKHFYVYLILFCCRF